MYKIIEKRQLSADVFYFKVNAPEIARNRKAGQFVLVQLDILADILPDILDLCGKKTSVVPDERCITAVIAQIDGIGVVAEQTVE